MHEAAEPHDEEVLALLAEAAGTAQARQPAVEVEGGERRRLLQQQVRGRQRVHRPRRRRRRKAETGPKQRSEEHTSELQSLMRISYAVFCLKKKKTHQNTHDNT